MNRQNSNFASRAVLGLLMVVCVSGTTAFAQSNLNPGVAPPNTKIQKNTYSEWDAKWWKWVMSIPADSNPLFDETGAGITTGQSGNVWYLVGVFNETGTAVRSSVVPPGKHLFFPILNVICSTATGDGSTEEELRACAEGIRDTAIDLACEIDGVPVQNLQAYRTSSPLYILGPMIENNIFGLPAGLTTPAVSGGYHLILSPLSAGTHTIHFHGTFPTFPFTLDITYYLTVSN